MRIAHLTDLHLRANLPGTSVLGRRRSRDAPALIARALADARQRGAEVVAITGDLVDVPSFLLADQIPPAFDPDRWLSALEADYRLIRDLLDDSELPYIVLPGNHDAYDTVERVFGTEPFVRDIGELRFVSFWDREDEANVPRRTGSERALFEEVLAQQGRTQVHLQHFVITPALNQDWPHTYREGEELRQRIVDSGRVRLSVSGHYHPGTELTDVEGSAFVAGSALVEPPHCYRLYDVPGSPVRAESRVTMQIVPVIEDRPPRRAVFLRYESCFTTTPGQRTGSDTLRLTDQVAPALRGLSDAGYALVGLIDESWAARTTSAAHLHHALLDRCAELFTDVGVVVDATYVASGVEVGGPLGGRTPQEHHDSYPTLVQASTELHLDLSGSHLIDDSTPAAVTRAAARILKAGPSPS